MDKPPETGADARLKVLIRYLVLSFMQAGILSRQVGDRYYVCVIVPYDGGPEKTVQIERAWLAESARSIKELERVLSPLNLPLLFQTCERYDVRAAHPSTANEGWPAASNGGTVLYGPFPLSGSSSPTRAGPLFPLRAS